MASTRLRKAFHYPSDSSDSELDEEHQERLITTFQTQDAAKNTLYRKAFVSIPIFAVLFFFYSIFTAPSAQQRLIALLSLSSLVCTAYILYFMPVEAQERKGKRAMYKIEAEKGPVERYLVYLDGGLAGLLLLAAGRSWQKGLGDDAWRECLPAGVLREMVELFEEVLMRSDSYFRPHLVRETTACTARPGRAPESSVRVQRRLNAQ